MPTLKERIENNLVVFFLAAMITGFLAGIAAFQGVLKISGQTTIAVDSKRALEDSLRAKEVRASELSAEVKAKNENIEALQSELLRERSKKPEQRWLRIRGIEGLEGFNARIIARVNGTAFSYPSRAVWSSVGPGMSTEDFPLPVGADEYRVSFEILSMSRDAKFSQFQSQEVIRVTSWPFETRYRIFALTQEEWGTVRGIPTHQTRQRRVAGSILFEIR